MACATVLRKQEQRNRYWLLVLTSLLVLGVARWAWCTPCLTPARCSARPVAEQATLVCINLERKNFPF